MTQAPSPSQPSAAAGGDVTGRDRLARSVIAGWLGQLAFIISGFVLPRLIHKELGLEILGVWDFGWSVVAYFALVQSGLISAINRSVARTRAVGDVDAMNRAVSSGCLVLGLLGLGILAVSVAASLSVPLLLPGKLGGHESEAGWVVLLLGASIAVQIGMGAFGGVLTGCHRWDLHHGLQSAGHLLSVTGMIVALYLGGSLPVLAGMSLLGELACRTTAGFCALRVCSGLRLRWADARLVEARGMMAFGAKGTLPNIGDLVLNSSVSWLVVLGLGPAALPLYARPMALIRHARAMVQRFAFVLVPTASSLDAMKSPEKLRALAIEATHYGACIALPMIAVLAILGGPILHLWMGALFAHSALIAVLAVGHVLDLVHRPLYSVLVGLNRHGAAGALLVGGAVAGVGGAALALLVLKAGLVGAAIGMVVPLALTNVLLVPWIAARELELRWGAFARAAYVPALRAVAPFAVLLGAARWIFAGSPALALLTGLAVGGAVLAGTYWRAVLPPRIRTAIRRRFGLHTPDSASARPAAPADSGCKVASGTE